MLSQLWRSYQAILKTGVLGNYSWWSIALFLGCFWRYGASLYTLVVWSSQRFPDHIALGDPQQQLTFQALRQNSNKLARVLKQSLGLRPKQTIGLLCKNRIIFVEVLLACSKLNIDVLLLHTLALDNLETIDLLICDPDYQSIIENSSKDNRLPKVIYTPQLTSSQEALQQTANETYWARFFKPASRLILLSSGSTGKPKITGRHTNFSQRLSIISGLLEQLQLRAGVPTLLTTPLAHGQGLATLAFALAIASPLYISPTVEAHSILKAIQEHQIKVLVVVPTTLYRLLESLRTTKTNISSLQMILCGSAPLHPDITTRCLNDFGPILYNLYGTSETGVISLATPQDLAQSPDSVGQVLSGLKLKIDPKNHEIQLCNKHGRVIWNTGDAGFLDASGRLVLHGRIDDMLICGGQNVYPQMIEDNITRALPYVLESAVVGIPDPEYGQTLHYFIVVDSADITQTKVIEDISKLMPKSLRPSKLSLVSELPKNQIGKLKRYDLNLA